MNAQLLKRELPVANRTLQLFAIFHLNLAFSSIEEVQRGEVITPCYWPLLGLAEKYGSIGIEGTEFTLQEIAARDPAWIARATRLFADGWTWPQLATDEDPWYRKSHVYSPGEVWRLERTDATGRARISSVRGQTPALDFSRTCFQGVERNFRTSAAD